MITYNKDHQLNVKDLTHADCYTLINNFKGIYSFDFFFKSLTNDFMLLHKIDSSDLKLIISKYKIVQLKNEILKDKEKAKLKREKRKKQWGF